MMFTDYYAENSCTAGRSTFITGQVACAPASPRSAFPGAAGRPAGARHHHRPGAQAARLRHRPVRQEPSRRPRRVSADQARLRRILRQPLSPQRRGGAGTALLSEERHGIRQGQLAARRAQGVRRRQDRGHRPAQPQADGDDRRRNDRRRDRLHAAAGQGQQAVLHLDEHDAHARLHPRPAVACAARAACPATSMPTA